MRALKVSIYAVLISAMVTNPLIAFAQGATPAQSAVPAPLPALRTTMAVPVLTEPKASELDRTKEQVWHRVTMSLSGSMCPACLMEAAEKLREVPGISFVKIEGPKSATSAQSQPSAQTQSSQVESSQPENTQAQTSQPKHRNALAIIIYDSHEIKLERLQNFMKRELYKVSDIRDIEFAP